MDDLGGMRFATVLKQPRAHRLGSGDNLSHPVVYLSIAVDEHRGSSARLEGAIADVDRELGRIVAR